MNYVFMGRLMVVGVLTAFSAGFGIGLSIFSVQKTSTAAIVEPEAIEPIATQPTLVAASPDVYEAPSYTDQPVDAAIPASLEQDIIEDTDKSEDTDYRIAALSAPEILERPVEEVEKPSILRAVTVGKGDTLSKLLSRNDIPRQEAYDITVSLKDHFDPRRLRVGQNLSLELNSGTAEAEFSLASLEIEIDSITTMRMERSPEGEFQFQELKENLTEETQYRSGQIRSSLSADASRAGVPAGTLQEMIRLFSWDVDFGRDIHPGDGFELVYEQSTNDDGSYVESGPLIYARLNLDGHDVEAFRFRFSDGSIDYYGRDGKSVRKSLLKTPVDGARMSSGFGNRRHPIKGYIKKHKGVDFAAPTGTPIFAAGKGKIIEMGRKGGYGNYVRIRHNGTYDTAYAHLHGFKKTLKKGNRVSQGDVIGYVGSTGFSTGPHLHYEVIKNGVQINPLKAEQINLAVLNGADLKLFQQQLASIDGLREELSTSEVAASGE